MCIIFVAHHVHPKYPLIIASNRDEFLDRPTEPMKIWSKDDSSKESESNKESDASQQHSSGDERHCRGRSSLSGRDLVAGGTWLGINLPDNENKDCTGDHKEEDGTRKDSDCSANKQSGLLRWIGITNFREVDEQPGRPSRGGLLAEYLGDKCPPADKFVSSLRSRGHEFNGFNLLFGDDSGIYYYGNRANAEPSSNESQPLPNGIYGLSNGLLDSPWPKVERGKEMLRLLCQKDTGDQSLSVESFHAELMNMLSDRTQPASDDLLPQTGFSIEAERYKSSIFVPRKDWLGKEYGTISSTTILVDLDGKLTVLERQWYSDNDRWFQIDL